MKIIWWFLDLFIVSHFLPRFPFQILTHEIRPVSFVIKNWNIFIIHHKILIFHITFWILITITITVYDIYKIYCFTISMCFCINSIWIFTFSLYNRNKYWPSSTSCGDFTPTYFSLSSIICLLQIFFLIIIGISSYFIIIPSSSSLITLIESVVNNVISLHNYYLIFSQVWYEEILYICHKNQYHLQLIFCIILYTILNYICLNIRNLTYYKFFHHFIYHHFIMIRI